MIKGQWVFGLVFLEMWVGTEIEAGGVIWYHSVLEVGTVLCWQYYIWVLVVCLFLFCKNMRNRNDSAKTEGRRRKEEEKTQKGRIPVCLGNPNWSQRKEENKSQP